MSAFAKTSTRSASAEVTSRMAFAPSWKLRGVGGFQLDPDPEGKNPVGDDKGKDDKAGGDKSPGDKGDRKSGKSELPTEEEIERRAEEKAQAKLAAERDKDRKRVEKERADAAEEEARKRGEFEKIANTEKGRREEAEARALRAERSEQINDALVEAAADHEGYSVKVFKTYVKPLVMAELKEDAKPEDVAKLTKSKVADYVKDNPRSAKSGGAPAAPSGGRLPAKPGSGSSNNGNNRQHSTAGVDLRF